MAKGNEGVSRLVRAVEGGKEFREWRAGNKAAYLSSVFIMAGNAAQLKGSDSGSGGPGNEWLVSYYDEADDTFTTFSTSGSQRAAKEQAFKKGKSLPRLDAETVQVGILKCVELAEAVRTTSYKGEETSRIIIILQPLARSEILAGNEVSDGSSARALPKGSIRPVWNITYITASFNVINVKIDAESGKVLSHHLSGVMDFMQKDK
ncbi:MAG TPA: hypothetical protein VI934_02430 [Candidatus Nanoarchaeia archaeon]|nr:hypothetical protein [Candidatus Nanoarchaeia archaeon]